MRPGLVISVVYADDDLIDVELTRPVRTLPC